MRAVYSKADTWATWQFGAFPYLPFPYQWHARYEALEKWGVDGTMESWSYGFKPNWVAEMRAWYSWSDAPALDPLLRSIARREFGAGSEARVLKAWEHFSQAVRVVPEHGPTWGGNNGVAAPMFFQKPTKPRAMTLEHSWTDQVRDPAHRSLVRSGAARFPPRLRMGAGLHLHAGHPAREAQASARDPLSATPRLSPAAPHPVKAGSRLQACNSRAVSMTRPRLPEN